jgi:phosphatidylserine decarboxylase
MTIHKEGYKILFIAIITWFVINVALFYLIPDLTFLRGLFAIASLGFFLLLLQFFRSPSRKLTINDNQIIAPADGKVVVIEETTESEYFKDKRIQISIFMSPLNVHINRYPIGGEVVYQKYHPGLFLVAWEPKSSTDNERTTVVIRNNKGTAILMKQIAGAVARRIICYSKTGDKASQCQEMGFIKFGSRVDVLLPLGAKINVNLNQKVKGGVTVLGTFS